MSFMHLKARIFRKAPLASAVPPTAPTLQERIAAIQQISDGHEIRTLAGLYAADDPASSAFPADLARAAQARLAELIDEGSIDFAALCDHAENRAALFSVLALCKDTRRLPQALAAIDDAAQIMHLVLESPSSRVRQLAAETIEDPVVLRQLLKQVREKDKNVYKILRHKCDALIAVERKAAEIASEAASICASLERHSHRSYDPLYEAVFGHLNIRWHAICAQTDANVAQRIEPAIERCREVIAAHQCSIEEQATAQAAQQTAEAARQRAAQAAQEEAVARANAEAQRRQEAAAAEAAEEAVRAERLAAQEQVLRQIGGLIHIAQGALRDGNTQKAAGLRRAIEEKLAADSAMPGYLARNLQQLDDKLNELKQWKDYAVAPKRIELVQEMEALIGLTEEPQALAERIKALQQDWRTISKGIASSDTSADWERFHQASQAAYQPCHEYFEAQARLREKNLDSRKAVLERLTAFEATQAVENPDGRLIERVLREAPQEWRRHFPVDREAGRAVQGDFDATIERLKVKLDAWNESNAADKQSLIKRARHLLTQEDSREVIDAVKALQVLWKALGTTPRAKDQSLWSEFREVCDAAYQRRRQAHAEYTATLEAAKLKAMGLCEEVEGVAALSGAALLEVASKIAEWRAAFDALGELPRADARGLRDRFERALGPRCDSSASAMRSSLLRICSRPEGNYRRTRGRWRELPSLPSERL
jgi:Domain of Unknown Function (DUF349)